ncbi:hypothetical protein C8Q74DRAFT_1292281 [Fomes fomentarius]|nr:hypothetical protein C8Q74DRAFT_1292281 [Fomes fomentarius]
MNALSRREEETLLKKTKESALKECDPVVKEFALCAEGRTFSVAWECRQKFKALQDCMQQYTSPEAMTAVRTEYLRLRNEQQKNVTPGCL